MTETQPKKRSYRSFLIFGIGFITGAITLGIAIFTFYWVITNKYMSMAVDESDATLGKFYDIHVTKTLAKAEADLNKAKNEYERWLALSDLAVYLVDIGRLDDAQKYATELLEAATRHKNDWNYGNAIHKGHIALGRIALRKNNNQTAIQHLIDSGKTPGSPQLNSFGPNMLLAKELLEKGERDAVMQYLDLCGKFWQMSGGRLERWKDIIKTGGIPNFAANLLY